MSLDTLHFEAKVPHYGAKLQKSMNRFFKTMTPEKPVTRNNVSFAPTARIGMIADQVSSSSNSTMASTGHTVWETRKARKSLVSFGEIVGDARIQVTCFTAWESANSRGLQVEEIHFRSERQTLRRLPRSGALMFTIRTYFEPMTTIAKEPHVPGRLAEAIRNWDEDTSVYKGRAHWDHLLLPYLDEQHQLQVNSGILEKPEGEYPY